ncbi:MAG: transporter [Carboxylicivirga sp.]|jgi:hypothetical protein|nr:transporter [Carboxylicivirga sp.]
MKSCLTFFLLFALPCTGTAQTCCSGGTPLISNLGIQSPGGKSFNIQLSYDYNFLNKLYDGSTLLNDDNRERLTQTLFLQLMYGINDQWSLNLLSSYVRQERTITSDIGINQEASNGIGDLIILAQYAPFKNLKRSLTIAAGPKLPTGKFDAHDQEFGITLSPDLQPGSGSLDAIIGLSYTEGHPFRTPGMSYQFNVAYRYTTPAERFDGDLEYRFGNELLINNGLSYTKTFSKFGLTPSAFISYRHTSQDRADDSTVAGTGGHWINLLPGISIEPAHRWSFFVSGEIPLYRHLNGTQLTTTYRLNIGLTLKIL